MKNEARKIIHTNNRIHTRDKLSKEFAGKNNQLYLNPRYIDHILPGELLNICTVAVNQNECIHTLYESLRITCKSPWKMHVIDNGSIDSEVVELSKFCNQNKINFISRKCRYNINRASQAHGDALDFIVKSIGDDNSLMTLVDSDFYFVKKGWDLILRSSLPRGGHITTMRGFNVHKPAAFMTMFRKRYIKNRRISFMPIVSKTGKALEFKDVGHGLEEIQFSKWQRLSNVPSSESAHKITSIEGSYDIAIDVVPIASHLSRGRMAHRRREVHVKWAEECRKYFNEH